METVALTGDKHNTNSEDINDNKTAAANAAECRTYVELNEELFYACRVGDIKHLVDIISIIPNTTTTTTQPSSFPPPSPPFPVSSTVVVTANDSPKQQQQQPTSSCASHTTTTTASGTTSSLLASSPSSPPLPPSSPCSPYLLSLVDSNGNTLLHLAAANGHSSVVSLLVDWCPALVAVQNKSGNTALHWAVQNGRTGVVEVLMLGTKNEDEENRDISTKRLAGLVDVLAVNSFGRSPLGEAFRLQPPNAELVALLLDHASAAALQQEHEQQLPSMEREGEEEETKTGSSHEEEKSKRGDSEMEGTAEGG
eukprot:GHVS01096376.1.p1 GENE.GHVS01096376.1~~GHVS01096376.1.p1  ORF type:complete len:310 (+),score=109.26 GHVS01096376.1:56-985(+)